MKDQKVRELFAKDIFAAGLGITITELEESGAAVKLTVTKEMLSSSGSAGGGVVFSLVDFSLSVMANLICDGATVNMNVNINYCKPASLDDVLTAKAVCISKTGKSVSCNIIVTNQNQDVIAVAHGSSYKEDAVQGAI